MQVGEINAMSNVLSGIPITGIQLMPTSGLTKDGSGVSVSGIARSSGSRGDSPEQSADLQYARARGTIYAG